MAEPLRHVRVVVTAAQQDIGQAALAANAKAGAQVIATDEPKTVDLAATATYTTSQIHVVDGGWTA